MRKASLLLLVPFTVGLLTMGCDDPPVVVPDTNTDTSLDDTSGSDVLVDTVDAGPDGITPDGDATSETTLELPPQDVAEVSDTDGGDVPADGDVLPDVPLDAGPVGCEATGCDAGEVCAPGGGCVKDCSIEYPGFDNAAVFEALAPGWEVVGMHCGGSIGTSAFQPLDSTTVLELYGVDGATESMLLVDKVTFGEPAVIETVAMTPVPGSLDALEWFPGQRLRLDPAGEVFGYGFTEPFDTVNFFSAGQVSFGSLLAPGAPTAVEASSNYDLAAIDKDNWLVASRSVNNVGASSGVYLLELAGGSVATRVAGGLGIASGNLAIAGDAVIMGGFADPWPSMCDAVTINDGTEEGNKAFYISMAALNDAKTNATPVDALCEATELVGVASDFSFLSDGRILSGNKWTLQFLTVHTLVIDSGGAVSLSDPTPLALNDVLEFAKGVPGSDGQIMIQTSAGYMLVAPVAAP